MGIDNLEEFLKKKKKSMEQNKISWEEEKQKWMEQIETFYKQLQSFLNPLQNKGLITIEFEEMIIQEEYFGEYSTKKLNVTFPDQRVVIEPIGNNIIGAMGRIDMIGKTGSLSFLLVDEEADGPKITVDYGNRVLEASGKYKNRQIVYVWKIVTPPPNVKYIQLNDDSFSDALLGVIDE